MSLYQIVLQTQKKVFDELLEIFQGEAIEQIIFASDLNFDENILKILENSFEVDIDFAPEVIQILENVVSELCYDKGIKLYVGNGVPNKFLLVDSGTTTDDIIIIDSIVLDLLSDEELKFFFGYSIGFFYCNAVRIEKVVNYVYSNNHAMPFMLRNKIDLWEKLSVLSADRFGLIACKNLDVALSSIVKLTIGFSTSRLKISSANISSLLNNISKQRVTFLNTKSKLNLLNSLRVEGLQIFYESRLYDYSCKSNSKKIQEDEELTLKTNNLLENIDNYNQSTYDKLWQNFIVGAGIKIAIIDNEFDEKEYLEIVRALASFYHEPEKYLEKIILNYEDADELFISATTDLIDKFPEDRVKMLEFIIDIALADGIIEESEIEIIYLLGIDYMKFSKQEVASIFSQKIRDNFIPLNIGKFRK